MPIKKPSTDSSRIKRLTTSCPRCPLRRMRTATGRLSVRVRQLMFLKQNRKPDKLRVKQLLLPHLSRCKTELSDTKS